MNYVIRWKSKVSGRVGRGTKELNREEADRLAEELNMEYPDIEHETVEALPSLPQPEEHQPEHEPSPA